MTLNGGNDAAYLEGKVIRLDAEVQELKEEMKGVKLLTVSVNLLTHQVKRLATALGITVNVQVPEDWEEITQVRRPALRKLKKQKTNGRIAAIVVAGLWVIREIIHGIGNGTIKLPWH